MKHNHFNCKLLYSLLIIALLFINCADSNTDIPSLNCNQPNLTPNVTVSSVYEKSNSTISQYLYDDIIEAYVISSDEDGNFYKTIYFQTLPTNSNPAVGFALPIDLSDSYINYAIGNKVYIKMKNLYTDIYNDGMRIGDVSNDSYGKAIVGRISQNDYKSVVNASCDFVSENSLVRTFGITELLNPANINTLVEIKDAQLSAEAKGKRFFEETNNSGGGSSWVLEDGSGNQLFLRTSSYCNFAQDTLPSGRGTIRGVLTKYYSDYQLVVRSPKDIVFDKKRKEPLFSENFQTVTDGTNINLPGWLNAYETGTTLWKGVVYSTNSYAEFAISSSKVDRTVAWLISPKIDLLNIKNPVLTFRAAQDHLDVDSPDNSLRVLVSENFDGTNFLAASWVTLPAILPKQATPWDEFVGSGTLDLSAYKGKVNIAFKYTGSGTNASLDGTFQIDDVKVYGNK